MLLRCNKQTLIYTSNILTCIFISFTLIFFINSLTNEQNEKSIFYRIMSRRIQCHDKLNYIDYGFSLLLGVFINLKPIRNLGVL